MSVSDGQSIRPFLDRLERDGSLRRIAKPVDRSFELSAFLSAADAGPALERGRWSPDVIARR